KGMMRLTQMGTSLSSGMLWTGDGYAEVSQTLPKPLRGKFLTRSASWASKFDQAHDIWAGQNRPGDRAQPAYGRPNLYLVRAFRMNETCAGSNQNQQLPKIPPHSRTRMNSEVVMGKNEVLWNMMGGQATDQNDCSKFKGPALPHRCKKRPWSVDMLPGTPYNQQVTNCCKGRVINSMVQDSANAVSSFQLTIGQAGTSNTKVKLPKNFSLFAPGPGYTCGPSKVVVPPTKFLSPDGGRVKQATMTWNITCSYLQFLSQPNPTCCVSLSSFYNDTIVPCPTCSCGCQDKAPQLGTCVGSNKNGYNSPLVQCTSHMCPICVHWHLKVNHKQHWRVKITITNFNYAMNNSQWNLVVQHPNFESLTQFFSFYYDPITPYSSKINNTAMIWGIKFYNDLLMQDGNVQSELLFQKDKSKFTFEGGRAFPQKFISMVITALCRLQIPTLCVPILEQERREELISALLLHFQFPGLTLGGVVGMRKKRRGRRMRERRRRGNACCKEEEEGQSITL
ncbi:COBRA, plant, partial [Dillenia turbinata]